MPKDENIPTAPPPKPDPRVLVAKPHPREVKGDANVDEWTALEQSTTAFLNELATELFRYRSAILAGTYFSVFCCAVPIVAQCGFKIGGMTSEKTPTGHTPHFTQPEERLVQVVGARGSMQLTDPGLAQGQFICDKESSHVSVTSCQGEYSVTVDYRCEVGPNATNIYRTVNYQWDPNCSLSTQ